MNVISTEFLNNIFETIEIIFVVFMPCITLAIGYRLGWKDAKEPSFRMTRTHHHNKLKY